MSWGLQIPVAETGFRDGKAERGDTRPSVYHAPIETPNEPDDKRLYDLFPKVGMGKDGAYIAVQEIRKMAGRNIVAKMEA